MLGPVGPISRAVEGRCNGCVLPGKPGAHACWHFLTIVRLDARVGIVGQCEYLYVVPQFLQKCQTVAQRGSASRSEEHTSELQSLMRISYAVFCLKKKKKNNTHDKQT